MLMSCRILMATSNSRLKAIEISAFSKRKGFYFLMPSSSRCQNHIPLVCLLPATPNSCGLNQGSREDIGKIYLRLKGSVKSSKGGKKDVCFSLVVSDLCPFHSSVTKGRKRRGRKKLTREKVHSSVSLDLKLEEGI